MRGDTACMVVSRLVAWIVMPAMCTSGPRLVLLQAKINPLEEDAAKSILDVHADIVNKSDGDDD